MGVWVGRIKVWINGRFTDIRGAKISIFDRGFLYGDGIFETMRSYAGVVFKLDEHIDRLFSALYTIKIAPPYKRGYFKDVINKVLKINNLRSAYVRLSITRGEGRFGIGYKDKVIPNIVIVAKEFEGYPEWMHTRGISVKVVNIRQNQLSPLSTVKSLNYLNCILARLDAQDSGFDEAILVNTKGWITEAATSNVFIVKKDILITPSLNCGVLPGITRNTMIDIAKGLRIKVKEKYVSYHDLLKSDEVFLTNSLAEAIPVVKVDSKRIGDGRPGDVTKLLHISYQKEVVKSTLF